MPIHVLALAPEWSSPQSLRHQYSKIFKL